MEKFKLKSPFPPRGDQPDAINQLVRGLKKGLVSQTLLGVTGSGKTFTMANVIAQLNKPALVISHNKTLAAQLCSEFREFFPENAVEYFVSYYDYYQPEAYMPKTDTYIEKDASINDEIDKLRLSATSSLMTRKDVIIVASVSCIYGLGSPEDYKESVLFLNQGSQLERKFILERLVQMQYVRNNIALERGQFRIKGEVLEIFPAYKEQIIRVIFYADEIEKISILNHITGEILDVPKGAVIYPAKHFITPKPKLEAAVKSIQKELKDRLKELESQKKLLEAQRLKTRTNYDLELLMETGHCPGIENYSRHLSGRAPGMPPATLLDYFPERHFITIIDESHVTIPQLRGMVEGDRSRKKTLIDYGFRLPSAYDNRPLTFTEFKSRTGQTIYTSATPGHYEIKHSSRIVEQIIRPTGLVDPEIIIKPVEGQVDDLIDQIKKRARKKERTLVTTLTKKMAEDLAEYLNQAGIKVSYLHSEIDTLTRIQILRELRLGKFDCLVGINLLREGLDLPEVSLVAILDADKEGFLRSAVSLIQTMGRAARHISGSVILYADTVTGSIKKAVSETNRRRKIQLEYNRKGNITPETIRKSIRDILELTGPREEEYYKIKDKEKLSIAAMKKIIKGLKKNMKECAEKMEFEKAIALRDEMLEIKKQLNKKLKLEPLIGI